jgi:hypothetical protein
MLPHFNREAVKAYFLNREAVTAYSHGRKPNGTYFRLVSRIGNPTRQRGIVVSCVLSLADASGYQSRFAARNFAAKNTHDRLERLPFPGHIADVFGDEVVSE